MKYLLLLIIGAVIWWSWRNAVVRRSRSSPTPSASTDAGEIIRCAHCGVYFPAGERSLGATASYCCDAHRLADEKQN